MKTKESEKPKIRSELIQSTPPHTSMAGTSIGASRNDVEQALAAIDAHLDRALSGNSREFLDANRQTGGE